MPRHNGESPAQINRLRTALAIGRQQRTQWPELAHALVAAKGEKCAGIRPVLALGVITAPSNTMRRRRIRQARDILFTRGERCAVSITFLLGQASMFTSAERFLIDSERKQHDDLLLLRAHDGAAASAAAHGGRAVAEKALAWFIHNANRTAGADYVAKVDDDSMVNLPRLVGELRAVTSSAPRPEQAHFGVHLYRLWDWAKHARGTPNAACGRHDDNGPPKRVRGMLTKMSESLATGGSCAGSMGPYPFLDGSFEVLGKGLLRDIFGSPRVRLFASSEFERAHAPYWSHEDAGHTSAEVNPLD